MKIIRFLLLVLSILLTTTTTFAKDVARNGNSDIVASVNNAKIKVVIKTTIVNTPLSIKTFYENKKVSIVENISIYVDGRSLFVPRSVFADLFEVRSAVISKQKQGSILIMSGADASEAYTVSIYFDNVKVYRRTLKGEESGVITEDTKYSQVIVE